MSLRVNVAQGWAKYSGLSIAADTGTLTMVGLIYRPTADVWSYFSPLFTISGAAGATPEDSLGMYGGTFQVETDTSAYDTALSTGGTVVPNNTWVPFVLHHTGPHNGAYWDLTLRINGSTYTRTNIGSANVSPFTLLTIYNATDASRGVAAGCRVMNFGLTTGLTWAQAQQQYTDCQTLTVDTWANPVTAGWLWSTDNSRTVGTGGTYSALNMTFDATGDPALTGGGSAAGRHARLPQLAHRRPALHRPERRDLFVLDVRWAVDRQDRRRRPPTSCRWPAAR